MRSVPVSLACCLLLAPVLLLATCFAPQYPTGIPCSERDTCPPGQLCQAGFCQVDPLDLDAGVALDGSIPVDARTGCVGDQDCSGDDVCGPGGMCVAATCTDGVKNGTETDLDCGGMCTRCADDAVCAGEGDCQSQVCLDQRCQAPRCQDGVTNGDEQCDDGNDSDSDLCPTTCLTARCGDGFTRMEAEECDDGNDSNADACTNACAGASCNDDFQNADELDVDCAGHCGPGSCDLGQSCGQPGHCASGACFEGSCVPAAGASCRAIHEAAPSAGDGLYTVDPDGAGGAAPFQVFCNMTASGGGWTRCLDFANTAVEDVNNNLWFDTCVDFTMAPWAGAEILIELRGEDGAIRYSATGRRERDWTQNQLTSTAIPSNQYPLSSHAPLILSNTDKMIITGKNSSASGCHGSLGNGYGIVVYPAAATDPAAAKLMVMPYRHQDGSNSVRSFGAGNRQWFENNEITFDGTTSWNTCGFPPGFPGQFAFYVR